jgi:hypothetical protein
MKELLTKAWMFTKQLLVRIRLIADIVLFLMLLNFFIILIAAFWGGPIFS